MEFDSIENYKKKMETRNHKRDETKKPDEYETAIFLILINMLWVPKL
jgi:hypothetical protein